MNQWGVSTRTLAERAGMHHSAIDHLRGGRRTAVQLEKAQKIAVALHAPVSLLFQDKP